MAREFVAMRSENKRILIAGIGNIFHGDDAFGVEVVNVLGFRDLPDEVQVTDFGIRSYDLAFAMLDGYEAVILIDAAPRGKAPGSIFLLDVAPEESMQAPPSIGHSMNPQTVLSLVNTMGGYDGRVLLVGCEPESVIPNESMSLSAPVRNAVEPAADIVVRTVEQLLDENGTELNLTKTSVGG